MKKQLLTILFLFSFSLSIFATPLKSNTIYVDVNGLVCDFCARALEKVFEKKEEVNSIDVDLNDKVITIHFHEEKQLDDHTITQLITDSGYNVREIRHDK